MERSTILDGKIHYQWKDPPFSSWENPLSMERSTIFLMGNSENPRTKWLVNWFSRENHRKTYRESHRKMEVYPLVI